MPINGINIDQLKVLRFRGVARSIYIYLNKSYIYILFLLVRCVVWAFVPNSEKVDFQKNCLINYLRKCRGFGVSGMKLSKYLMATVW